MRLRTFMFCFVLLIVTIGCQPVSEVETALVSPSIQQSTESPAPRISSTEQAEVTKVILIQPTLRYPFDLQTGTPWDKTQMPIFLEITQTISIGENLMQSPVIGVGPTIYFYDPGNKVLILDPIIALEVNAELLIGVTTVLQTPGQVYEKREIVQFPFAQPVLIQVLTLEVDTGTLTFLYGDEKLDLAPGERHTFKQVGGSNRPTVITTISNHDRLTEIQPIPSNGSWR